MSWAAEDEKRLAEIRARVKRSQEVAWAGYPEEYADRDWLLAKLDEEKRVRTEAEKENVRIAKQSAENRARAVRAEAAMDYEKRTHAQTSAVLTEERAKREADNAVLNAAANMAHESEFAAIARAEAAEARVAELEKELEAIYRAFIWVSGLASEMQ
jgi:hypothetical protein